MPALGAATGERGGLQQVRRYVALLGPQRRDLACRGKRRVHGIEARTEHGVEIGSRHGSEGHRAECPARASGRVDGRLQQQPHMDLELAHRVRLARVTTRVVAQVAIRDVCQGGLGERLRADPRERPRARAHVRPDAIGERLCLAARHHIAGRPIGEAMKAHAVAHLPTRGVLAVAEREVPRVGALRPLSWRTTASLGEPVLTSHGCTQKCAGGRTQVKNVHDTRCAPMSGGCRQATRPTHSRLNRSARRPPTRTWRSRAFLTSRPMVASETRAWTAASRRVHHPLGAGTDMVCSWRTCVARAPAGAWTAACGQLERAPA